eukprot:TRINITY_DN2827_c0_g1_i1.p1 TRINITY_DN2827_c0_g1~~TRINITY_DN2827_c0_g1_i1.p1  ORF type:complete len:482 (-),score=91.39 TRINITY_DN2827_c0_g1_i1:1904-3349(-)
MVSVPFVSKHFYSNLNGGYANIIWKSIFAKEWNWNENDLNATSNWKEKTLQRDLYSRMDLRFTFYDFSLNVDDKLSITTDPLKQREIGFFVNDARKHLRWLNKVNKLEDKFYSTDIYNSKFVTNSAGLDFLEKLKYYPVNSKRCSTHVVGATMERELFSTFVVYNTKGESQTFSWYHSLFPYFDGNDRPAKISLFMENDLIFYARNFPDEFFISESNINKMKGILFGAAHAFVSHQLIIAFLSTIGAAIDSRYSTSPLFHYMVSLPFKLFMDKLGKNIFNLPAPQKYSDILAEVFATKFQSARNTPSWTKFLFPVKLNPTQKRTISDKSVEPPPWKEPTDPREIEKRITLIATGESIHPLHVYEPKDIDFSLQVESRMRTDYDNKAPQLFSVIQLMNIEEDFKNAVGMNEEQTGYISNYMKLIRFQSVIPYQVNEFLNEVKKLSLKIENKEEQLKVIHDFLSSVKIFAVECFTKRARDQGI